jgi:hypothetical protein
MAESNLKRMTYQIRHTVRVSRPVVWANILLASICVLSAQAKMEASHKNPITLPVMDLKNWPKNFEAIDEYLCGLRGYKDHPLSYVHRTDILSALAALDTATGVLGSTHNSHADKMIAQGPILWAGAVVGPDTKALGLFAPSFLVDRATVREKLSEIFLSHDAFTVIKAAKKTCNGRLAYQMLYCHYLGPNNIDNMAGKAEKVLLMAAFHGEQHQWNFKKYALMHLKQHLILEALMAHGYMGINPGSKVRHLNAGIKTTQLNAVRTRIILDENLHVDFSRCVTLYKDFVKQSTQTTKAQLGIAAMSVNNGGRGTGEDCWYTLDKLRALPKDKQATIQKACADCKKKKGGKTLPKGGPKTGHMFGSVQKLKDKVKNQKHQLAAMHATAKSASKEANGAMESDSGSNGNQRKHSALTRQGKVPRKDRRKGLDSKS